MGKTKFNDQAMAAAGRANLRDVAAILFAIDADWWIEAGTFLGCIRNGGFIGHDSDIDIGLTDTDKADEILRRLEEIGFELKHQLGTFDRGLEISVIRDGVKVDLFFFYREGPTLWMACWRDDKMIRLDFEARLFDPTWIASMEGVEVRTPNDPSRYLTARYGPDWKTPDPSWRWDLDPACINWPKSDITREEIATRWPRKP